MTNDQTTSEDLIREILNQIVAEINDKRTLPTERYGLRLASVIVRRVAEQRGIKY